MADSHRLVRVDWIDSHSVDGWQQIDDHHMPCLKCATVGYVMDDTDDHIALAQSLSFNDKGEPSEINAVMWIPRPAIVKVSALGTMPDD